MLAVSILSAELRSASEARQKLTTALAAPEPVRAFDLAVLVAAEERHEEDVGEIRESIDQSIAELAERSSTRVRLAELVGSAADGHAVAAAVGATLFGSGAPDDDGSAFFAGSSEADYYDPANSFVDAVLQRRVGIPISLGLVYCECCERLGLPMVGLNAPAHLLVAPADRSLGFVVDAFGGGSILDADGAAELVARNAGMTFDYALGGRTVDGGLQRGRILLRSLRQRPMTPAMWCSRMLRNLLAVHAAAGDVVRTLGATERLRIVGEAHPSATSPREQRECAVQLAACLRTLRWEARREEAAALLAEALQGAAGGESAARAAAGGGEGDRASLLAARLLEDDQEGFFAMGKGA